MTIILFLLFLGLFILGSYLAFPKLSFIFAFILDLFNPPGPGGGGSSTFNKDDFEKRTKKERIQGMLIMGISFVCLFLATKF